jgi:hypothetical protein
LTIFNSSEDVRDNGIIKKPKEWRLGQAVFNYIDNKYGVARHVQFIERIDCFYDDEQIEPFCIACYRQLKNYKEETISHNNMWDKGKHVYGVPVDKLPESMFFEGEKEIALNSFYNVE